MTTESLVEILRAHLTREGLTLCRMADTKRPLDGMQEIAALREIVSLVEDLGGDLGVEPLVEYDGLLQQYIAALVAASRTP